MARASRSIAKRRRLAWVTLGSLVVGACVVVWLVRRTQELPVLETRWASSVALAPGVSAREGEVLQQGWRLVDIGVDLERAEIRVAGGPPGGMLQDMVPGGAVAAVNGGYFNEQLRPTGWLVDRGREHAVKHQRSVGGVVAVRGRELFIGPMGELGFAPDFAVQNGPRLIERGGRTGIYSDDGLRANRTIACDAAGRLHLVAVIARERSGPTLFETARLLATPLEHGGLGCVAALNLDGGPSTGVWLAPSSGIASAPPPVRIGYGLAVVPR
jgi:hypothetical protein